MAKPILLVIAGCNGSGKSTFSKVLANDDFQPFDYDEHFLKHYHTLLDIDIKEEMAHNLARQDLEKQVDAAIQSQSNFCYETNFNSTPLYWPQKFKDNGYELRMIYLCLDSIDEAQKRVAIRVQNGGHFVPAKEIEKRYHEGFANLDKHFPYFDCIDLFETSAYGKEPEYIFSIDGGQKTKHPDKYKYLRQLIPTIISLHG